MHCSCHFLATVWEAGIREKERKHIKEYSEHGTIQTGPLSKDLDDWEYLDI